MTYQSTGEMHLTFSVLGTEWQQMVFANEDSINLSAITIYATGMTSGTYCKVFIPSIHGGNTSDVYGVAFLAEGIGITFVNDAGGIGDVYIGDEVGNTAGFDVRWFPSLIGRGSASLVDPSMPFTGNRPNWHEWI